MRTMTSAVVALGAGAAILLGGAACGEKTDQGAGADRPAPTTTSSSDPSPDRQPARTPPAGGTAVDAAKIDATALPPRYPTMVWTQEDGRVLGVVAQEGGCGKASIEVDQADTQVVVTLIETTPAQPQACTMDLRYPKLTADLDSPLDDRTVVLKAEQRKR
jgi:hypothetical protein